MIAWLQQILNKIGTNADAAAVNTSLFAGQQQIHDDLTTAISSAPTAKSMRDILHKNGSFTFDHSTDSLEALRDKLDLVAGANSLLAIPATCDVGMTASATTIVSAALAGYGDDYFNNKFWMQIIRNANAANTAPERQYRQITDYVSATGTFTVSAFGANVEASDGIIVIHESLAFFKYYEYTSGSGNWTVPQGWNSIDVVIAAAGGAGGDGGTGRGGGGGGETVFLKNYKVIPGTAIPYVIGAGAQSSDGGNSSFNKIIAVGGLKGVSTAGGNGGSTKNGGAGGANGIAGSDGTQGLIRIGGGGGGGGAAAGGNGSYGNGGAAATGGGGGGGYANGGAASGGGAGGGGYEAGDNGTVNGTWGGFGGDGGILIIWRG